MYRCDRQETRQTPDAEMAPNRRLFPSARRHADRRVLAGGEAPGGDLGARSGHQPLSGARIAREPLSVAISAWISCAGSAARMTPPITATPAAPAATSSPTRP